MFRPDDQIELTIWRSGETFRRPITLKEREIPEPVASRIDNLEEEELEFWDEIPEDGRDRGVEQKEFEDVGFTLRALSTPEDHEKFNIFIHRVQPYSEAWNRGVRDGSELLELNGIPADDLTAIENEISNSLKNDGSLHLKIKTEEGALGFYKLY